MNRKAPAHYKFDWAVKDDYAYLNYGQYEARDGYHTKGNIWTDYSGYDYKPAGHMKFDYDINAQQSYGHGYNKAY